MSFIGPSEASCKLAVVWNFIFLNQMIRMLEQFVILDQENITSSVFSSYLPPYQHQRFQQISLLTTYPHASAAKCSITNSHQQEQVELPISVFPAFPRHPELIPFPFWQGCKKHVKSLLCLSIMFILYVWTRGFADSKCRNRDSSLLLFFFFKYTSPDSQDRSRGLFKALSQQLDKHNIYSCGL